MQSLTAGALIKVLQTVHPDTPVIFQRMGEEHIMHTHDLKVAEARDDADYRLVTLVDNDNPSVP